MKIKVHLRIEKEIQLENGRNMHLQKSNYKMEIVPHVKWNEIPITNGNENPIKKCKSNLKTKIKDHLKIEQKSP